MRLTRELVDLIPAKIEDPGPMANVLELEADNYLQRTTDDVLANLPDDDDLWVFAYGSLIWRSRFTRDARRNARVDGWQRKFCLGPDTRYRGNPDAPGYMLSLLKGGQCEGVVLRMAKDVRDTELLSMIETEPPLPPVWIDAQTPEGTVKCIAFVCPDSFLEELGKPSPEELVKCLATAVGMFGSMPDYVLNTVQCLEESGIHDPYLWEMQERVAEYLEEMR